MSLRIALAVVPILGQGLKPRNRRDSVCAVNTAMGLKLFTLHPGDNCFPADMRRGELFDFVLPRDACVRGSVSVSHLCTPR